MFPILFLLGSSGNGCCRDRCCRHSETELLRHRRHVDGRQRGARHGRHNRCCRCCCCRCRCPEPEPGPEPIEQPNGLAAFGGLWAGGEPVEQGALNDFSVVPLTEQYPRMNVGVEGNALEIEIDGIYEVNYSFTGVSNNTALVTLAVEVNGDPVPGTALTKNMPSGLQRSFSLSAIIPLFAGDLVTLGLAADTFTDITQGIETGATLTVKKLDEIAGPFLSPFSAR